MIDSNRYALIEWIKGRYIFPDNVEQALYESEVKPSQLSWMRFIDQLLLAFGVLMLSAGIIFFFAFNWDDLSRFQKFGIVDALLFSSLIAVWKLGLDKLEGQLSLFISSVIVGVLLALIGQTYQTGADPFQLFGVWAGLILPWALLGRLSAIWVLWWLLVNVSIYLYYKTFGGLLGFFFDLETMIWILFFFNTIGLGLWVGCFYLGISKIQSLWATRLLITVSGSLSVALAMLAIFEQTSIFGLLVYLIWIGSAYYFYRIRSIDIYVLSGCVLSVVVVVATLLGSEMHDAGGLFIIGFVVIAISALGGKWLKNIIREDVSK